MFLLGTTAPAVFATQNVWDVLRGQLILNHELSQPEVQSQLRWLIAHPSYLAQFSQAEPYIYHIVTEIKTRHLPGEMALIPMIESAYDPFAYSGAGAAGLWQLMPGTGSDLGLKRDWWFDGRRSIRPSTTAALNYLDYLHKFFHGDWVLAIAAYDSGEGTVSRAIQRSGQSKHKVNFWKLPVPMETKAYVPRLLALAEIIKYPDRYHVTLPDIPHVPYFEEVNIGSQIDLNHAAKLAEIPYKDLLKLNPGFNRWATAPYKPFKLLIPANKVARFNHNLAHVAKNKRVSWTKYLIKHKDETLGSIAKRHFTTEKLLRELNQLHSEKLAIGQFLLIPSVKNSDIKKRKPISKALALQQVKVIHIVQNKDNYESLEKRYQVKKQDIALWNHLSKTAALQPGSALVIWKKVQTKPTIVVIKQGDTLQSISQRYHTSLAKLQQQNPGIRNRRPYLGQKLLVG